MWMSRSMPWDGRVRTTGGPAPTTITNVSDAGVWTPTGYKSETDAANAWWRRQSA